jgi:hypothetical protein
VIFRDVTLWGSLQGRYFSEDHFGDVGFYVVMLGLGSRFLSGSLWGPILGGRHFLGGYFGGYCGDVTFEDVIFF